MTRKNLLGLPDLNQNNDMNFTLTRLDSSFEFKNVQFSKMFQFFFCYTTLKFRQNPRLL
jgi:hypothetical protein